jgi:hypothetical protein
VCSLTPTAWLIRGGAVLVDAMLECQARNARFRAEIRAAAPGSIEATHQQIADRVAWSQREHAFTSTNRRAFASAPGCPSRAQAHAANRRGSIESGDSTLRLIVFMRAATCAALTLGGGAWLAGLL